MKLTRAEAKVVSRITAKLLDGPHFVQDETVRHRVTKMVGNIVKVYIDNLYDVRFEKIPSFVYTYDRRDLERI